MIHTPGLGSIKVRSSINRVFVAFEYEVRLYDRLFKEALSGSGIRGSGGRFERHGYFVADRIDSVVGKSMFSRTVTLRDVWQK